MSRIVTIKHPQLYIERPQSYFVELGQLISSVGQDHFVPSMYRLIAKSVALSWVEVSEWTIDKSQSSVMAIQALCSAGALDSLPPQNPCSLAALKCDDNPLLKRVIEVDNSLLIHLNPAITDATGHRSPGYPHQCSLISRKANRRCLISLHRTQMQRDFSLQELSFLKSLSETLLPLVERHARLCRQEPQPKTADGAAGSPLSAGLTQLQLDFNERLMRCDVLLSAREKEACLEFLIGSTVREMAEKLCVKSSSVENYLKRAAAKLGVSGRHGLAKWMMDA